MGIDGIKILVFMGLISVLFIYRCYVQPDPGGPGGGSSSTSSYPSTHSSSSSSSSIGAYQHPAIWHDSFLCGTNYITGVYKPTNIVIIYMGSGCAVQLTLSKI